MKLDPKKTYMLVQGRLLDDGTMHVINGEDTSFGQLSAREVAMILDKGPRGPNDDDIVVLQVVMVLQARAEWVEK